MTHFSRFGRGYASQTVSRVLSDDEIQAVAPSVFATEAHESRSERYTYVPTIDVLRGLRKEGFECFSVAQSRSRIPGKSDFTKHMLRMRQAGNVGAHQSEGVPEVILVNSHDGTSSYQMFGGFFRFVCCNGMIAGDTLNAIKVAHKGDIIGNVIEGAYKVVDDFETVGHSVANMRAITLSAPEQVAFATAAIETRFDTTEAPAPIKPEALLTARRHDDKGANLWATFNRVQENVIRGGLRGRATTGRRMSTREITGIDQNVKTNRALWVLAEQMAAIKAAAA